MSPLRSSLVPSWTPSETVKTAALRILLRLLDQRDVGDRHLLVDRLRHVVDGQRGDGDHGERLHLDAGLRGGLGGGNDRHAFDIGRDGDLDDRQRQQVAGGISSLVRLAAMIPASCAVTSTSPASAACRGAPGIRRAHPRPRGRQHGAGSAACRRRRPCRARPLVDVRRSLIAVAPSRQAGETATVRCDRAGAVAKAGRRTAAAPLNPSRTSSVYGYHHGGQASAVEIRELDLRHGVEAVLRVRHSVSRVPTATPGRLAGTVGVRVVVHPDRAGVELRRDCRRPCTVTRPDARAKGETRCVRTANAVPLRSLPWQR